MQQAKGAVTLRLTLTIMLGLWLGEATPLCAQQIQAGFDFATAIPLGDFKQNVKNNGYGLGGQFAVGLGRTPLSLGADAGIIIYGSESRREPLTPTIPDVRVDVETSNNLAWGHLLLRAQPRRGAIRPYVDGLFGFKYLFTETTIRDDFDDQPIASETNLSDFALSYGFGGGIQVRLARLRSNVEILLDGKVRYLRGSEAEYLKEGSIRRENGMVFFDVLSSRTDMLTVQIGLTFRF